MTRERDLKETAEEWLEFVDRTKVVLDPELVVKDIEGRLEKYGIIVDKKCQCGVESIGEGMHSQWCPKGE